MFQKLHLLVLALASSLVTAWLQPLQAADQSSAITDQNPATTDQSSQTLEFVTVTATRRSERLQDVPMTVTNLDSSQLSRANVQTVGDIQNVTPGFRLDNHGGILQPTVRGVTTRTTCVACGNNVGIYVDGFINPNPMSLNAQLFNVDSIQVLKGPQGTLFGQNNVGGAVLVTTPAPSTETHGSAEVSAGSYDAQRYRAYLTTGLSDKVAVDVGTWLENGDGWVDNVYTNDTKFGQYENWGARTGIKVDVTDDLSFLFRYDHVNNDDPTGLLHVPFVRNGQVLNYAASLPGAITPTERGQIASGRPIIMRSHSDSFQLTGTLDWSFATLKSYSQYRKDEIPTWYQSYGFSNIPLLNVNIPFQGTLVTQELLLTSKSSDPLDWVAGAFYYDSTQSYDDVAQQTTGPLTPYTSTGMNARSIAVYGNATYRLLDRLFLTAGVRFTRDEMRDPYWIQAGVRTTLPKLIDNSVTPRASLRYALTDSSNVYLTFAEGYRPAIYNTGAFQTASIRPEGLTSYELGYKYAASRLSLELSGFYYDYTDQQVASNALVNGATVSLVTNAASSHMYGMDVNARVHVLDHVHLDLGAEWLHATYRSFPNAPGFTILPDGLEPATIVDASGMQMERSPDFTAHVGVTYTANLAGGSLALSANAYHTSDFYFDPANQLPQGAYTTLGLRAAWTSPSGRYVLSVVGDNVTDTEYYTAATQLIYGAGAVWGDPATIMGTVRMIFQ